jgi:hypothetical protein
VGFEIEPVVIGTFVERIAEYLDFLLTVRSKGDENIHIVGREGIAGIGLAIDLQAVVLPLASSELRVEEQMVVLIPACMAHSEAGWERPFGIQDPVRDRFPSVIESIGCVELPFDREPAAFRYLAGCLEGLSQVYGRIVFRPGKRAELDRWDSAK